MSIGTKLAKAVLFVMSGGVLAGAGFMVTGGVKGGMGHSADQPIDFFPQVHAGARQIPCAYCHRTAETADFAGMPSTRICIGCHRTVIPQSPEVLKLRSYW